MSFAALLALLVESDLEMLSKEAPTGRDLTCIFHVCFQRFSIDVVLLRHCNRMFGVESLIACAAQCTSSASAATRLDT